METLNLLLDGFGIALTLDNFILALIGCVLGTIFGALPGLGPANGVAILIPLSFSLGLSAASSMILLASVYYGAMYGGRISSILLNIPGDEPALMTTLDGYPMTQKGRAGEALTLTGLASFFGAMFATVGLVLLAPQLVKVAFLFGPAEYFALFVMAFATLGGVASNNQAKTVLASCLGLGISTIGVDHQTGVPRMSYGEIDLYDGIDFLVVIVGMFAVSEVFIFIENHKSGKEQNDNKPIIGNIIPKMFTVIKTIPSMIRGTFLGFFAGVLPGAGASLGSFIAYTFEKKISNKEDTFGKGDERGVTAPEAGNNAAAGGALVPMLALGVPGSGTTAVLLAMLMTLDITPGPLLFTQNPDVVWGLIAALCSKYLPKKFINSKIDMAPNITVMLSYKKYSKINISSVKFNNKIISWASNENSKERSKSNEILWTLQCTEKYSKKIIDLFKNNKNYYLKEIAKEFENLIGFKAKHLIFKNIHGWRYAYVTRGKKLKNVWIKKFNLGICADWMIGSKAEGAWLSANSLFKKTKKNPVSL